MWKRSKSGKITFTNDEQVLLKLARPSLFNQECIRKANIVVALGLFFVCGLSGFRYCQQSGIQSLGDRKLSTVAYFPFLHLNAQATGDESVPSLESVQFFEDGRVVEEDEAAGRRGCDYWHAELKVYMYDLPPEFHYGMISGYEVENGRIWPVNGSMIPDYPGGLNLQHSPEYWLTSDVLTSNMADRNASCTAFRVEDWEDADVVFVPFFASLSYNRYGKASEAQRDLRGLIKDKNDELQLKLVEFLEKQPAWQASTGRDHVIVIHHPNSMQAVRERLRNALFVVSDFGRYDHGIANIQKDVVAPYMHVIPTFQDDTSFFHTRTTLLFFQGAIVRKEGGKIRHELYALLKDEPDVHFTTGNTALDGFQSATLGMRSSKFCLNMAGDTPSSNRLFDSIVSHCVPVIISDDLELPFEDDLDYSQFCIFINSTESLQPGYVVNKLRNVTSDQWTQLTEKLLQVDHHFEYQHPTMPDDSVNMVWKAIARKLPAIKFTVNRQRRFTTEPSWQHRKLLSW